MWGAIVATVSGGGKPASPALARKPHGYTAQACASKPHVQVRAFGGATSGPPGVGGVGGGGSCRDRPSAHLIKQLLPGSRRLDSKLQLCIHSRHADIDRFRHDAGLIRARFARCPVAPRGSLCRAAALDARPLWHPPVLEEGVLSRSFHGCASLALPAPRLARRDR